jgi:hypothetical protein
MKNGATIVLESSWALNTLLVDEAKTILCGDKAGADMLGTQDCPLRINGERFSKLYTTEPTLMAGGAAFFEGLSGGSPADLEARAWIATSRTTPSPHHQPSRPSSSPRSSRPFTSPTRPEALFFD